MPMKKNILFMIINLWKLLVSLPRFMHQPIGFLIGIIIYMLPIKRNIYSKKILIFVLKA